MNWLAQITAQATPEWVLVAAGVLGLWGRLEHRLTRLETKLELLRKRNVQVDSKEGDELD